AERMLRVKTMAGLFADLIGADRAKAERAAMLAKADLRTLMVGEFPELQGIMGEYYAKYDGEAEEVALAIREHYQPRYAGDALPSTPVSLATALADKMAIGSSASARCRPAKRTRSRFAATPSACCACSLKRPCLSASTR
ncbi:MAG: glycine--tRNA ligase subunit beta, partial [Sutterella wadsworthensis]